LPEGERTMWVIKLKWAAAAVLALADGPAGDLHGRRALERARRDHQGKRI
jgi:hypothetical protein